MRADLLKKLESIQILETHHGYSVVGFKESILPLGRLARIKYKKKLKTRRLIKKYAKKLLEEAIKSFIKEHQYDDSKKSNTGNFNF